MIRSRFTRGLALGTSALAAGAMVVAVAPAATASEISADDASATSTSTARTALAKAVDRAARLGTNGGSPNGGPNGGSPNGGGPGVDAPYVGARLVVTKDGATVAHVDDGSPADTAGVEEGDVVVSIDSVAIDHRGALREALSAAEAGDEITVVIDHDGSKETVVITLGDAADRPAPPAAEDVPWVGARLVHIEGKDGVLVRTVAADGPADTAGLAAGDVVISIDGQAVTDWWQAREIIAEHAPGDALTVVVDRDGASKTLTVTLGSLDDAVVRSHASGTDAPAPGAQGEPGGRLQGLLGRSADA